MNYGGRRLLPILLPMLASLACGTGAESPQSDTLGTTTAPEPAGDSSSGGTTGDPEPSACTPGTQITCMCLGSSEAGFQVCNQDGSGFGECMCEETTSSSTGPGSDDTSGGEESTGEVDPCGDSVCDADAGEDCASCEADCGVCEPCDQAPSCEGAEIPPIIDNHAAFLDDPMAYVGPEEILDQLSTAVEQGGVEARLIAAALAPASSDEHPVVGRLRSAFKGHPAGAAKIRAALSQAGMPNPTAYVALRGAPSAAELSSPVHAMPHASGLTAHTPSTEGAACDDPRMRIRVATLTVHEEDDDFLNDEIYCAITTEGANHAELKVTPLTTPLDEGDSVDYSLDGGLVWGQAELTAPMSGILINYNCIESEGSGEGYAALLGAIGDAVGDFDGESVGADGWVFPAAGVVTNLLAGALTLDGDDLLFNGTQTIPENQLLPLTFGGWWSVRRDGTNILSDWDWELRMEIWGCHNYGTGVAPAG